jgi:hypothetical protein
LGKSTVNGINALLKTNSEDQITRLIGEMKEDITKNVMDQIKENVNETVADGSINTNSVKASLSNLGNRVSRRLTGIKGKIKNIMLSVTKEDQNKMVIDTRAIEKKLSTLSSYILNMTEAKQKEIKPQETGSIQGEENKTKTIKYLKEKYLEAEEEIKDSIMTTVNNLKRYHPNWSRLTFIIMFAPGFAVFLYAICSQGLKNIDDCPLAECPGWFQAVILILGILMSTCFPLGMLLAQLFEIFILVLAYCSTGENSQKMIKTIHYITVMVAALEAFFESVPQIILQFYIIVATGEITSTQLVSILISLAMLTKTTIMYDLMYSGTDNKSFTNTVKYLLAVLPLYMSSAIFKVGPNLVTPELYLTLDWFHYHLFPLLRLLHHGRTSPALPRPVWSHVVDGLQD